MKMELGGFRIESDSREFILQEKKVIGEGRLTKPENVGKEMWEDIGYFSSLEGLVKFLCKRVVLENDDLEVVLSKIEQIQKEIKAIEKRLGMK